MGLFGTTVLRTEENHYHSSPDKIEVTVHENKAVTDEAVRYMEDAHNKAMQNIIAKVKVEDNLVNGNIYLVEQPWNAHDLKIICKFKINGHDFVTESQMSRSELYMDIDNQRLISDINSRLDNIAKSIMLWYAVKSFSAVAYKTITGNEMDMNLISR